MQIDIFEKDPQNRGYWLTQATHPYGREDIPYNKILLDTNTIIGLADNRKVINTFIKRDKVCTQTFSTYIIK